MTKVSSVASFMAMMDRCLFHVNASFIIDALEFPFLTFVFIMMFSFMN